MTKLLKRLWREEEGVTSIEYALLASLIALVIVTSVTSVGTALKGIFNQVAAAF